MVAYRGSPYMSIKFEPTPRTLLEWFRLLFKRKRYQRKIEFKDEIIEITSTKVYKMLGDKMFILDSYGHTHISLPIIVIEKKKEMK